MHREARLIYNPEAGGLRRSGSRLLGEALTILQAQGISTTLVPSEGPQTAGAVARRIADSEHPDLILVAGGDGTLNEVANGMIGSSVPLGILPAGTANVLANELGLGTWRAALRNIGNLRPAAVSAGYVEFDDARRRHFLAMAGAGFDARLVYSVDLQLKRQFGKLAYWVAGFSQIGRKLEQLEVEINGNRYLGSFCLASRVRNYGGDLAIAPTVHMTDADLEVVIFPGTVTATYLRHLFTIVAGRLEGCPDICIQRTKELRLYPSTSDPVHVQVDGEHVGMLPARVGVTPNALQLLVPDSYLRKSGELAA